MPEWGEWAGGTWLGEADAGVGLRPGCAVREIMGYNSPLQGRNWIGEYCNEFKHPVFLVSGWPIFVGGSVFCLFAGLFKKNTDPISKYVLGRDLFFKIVSAYPKTKHLFVLMSLLFFRIFLTMCSL